MPEQFKPYSPEEAWNEAELIKNKMSESKNVTYSEAEGSAKFGRPKESTMGVIEAKLEEISSSKEGALLELDDLIAKNKINDIAKNIQHYIELDKEGVFNKLIKIAPRFTIAFFLEIFSDFNHNDIALKIILAGGGSYVAENLDKFHGLDHKLIAQRLFESGNYSDVTHNLNKFHDLDQNEMSERLFNSGNGHLIAYSLDKFHDLDHELIAQRLFESSDGYAVADNLDKFNGLDHNEVALKLLESYKLLFLQRNISKFENLNLQVVLKLVEVFETEYVARIIKSNARFSNEIALKLIEMGKSGYVAYHFDKFQELGGDVALKLLERDVKVDLTDGKKVNAVVFYIDQFKELNKEVAVKLIESNELNSFARNIKKFKNLDKDVLLAILTEDNYYTHEHVKKVYPIINANLDLFHGLDSEVLIRFLDICPTADVVRNIDKFGDVNHEEVVEALIDDEQMFLIEDNFDVFTGLNLEKIESLREINNLTLSESIVCVVKNKQDDRGLYEVLSSEHPGWFRDEENISKPFKSGMEIFGQDKMFNYLNRQGLTRHDGLHNFLRIIDAYKSSSLKPAAFYNNILDQVKRDSTQYEDGTAHHHLNSVVNNIDLDFDAIQRRAKSYTNVEKLQALLSNLGGMNKVFASWKNLKKYDEVCELLGRTEILDELQNLNTKGNEKLYKYVETLAFHPNISMSEVMQFWQNPDEFLNASDSHTPEEVHDRKKPSNYINIPNLDLTATELRDALVNGDYDQLQALAPMEISYQISTHKKLSLRTDLARQIGIRDKTLREKLGIGNQEELVTNSQLFSQLNKIFKVHNSDLGKYLSSEIQIDSEIEIELEQFRTQQATDEFKVKINRKSDPDGVVAGNDTACCMPFGSGKNNVYTFNPVSSLLTMQKKNVDGTYRTIAQSVLTLDKEIKENVADLVDKMSTTEIKLHEVVSEDVLVETPSIITCDNIEVSHNFMNQEDAGEIIMKLYQDFFKEYLAKHGKGEQFDQNRIIIGQGYSDALTDLPQIANTFVPEAPIGYSDNLHRYAYLLDLSKEKSDGLIIKKTFTPDNIETSINNDNHLPKGVKHLTYRDSLTVAYIEGKAYEENESLIQNLHNMENALIAKDVNNIAKKRSNMSFKYVDNKGRTSGYILAYEGKMTNEDEQIVYVSDLATDRKNKRAGGSLILAFIKQYQAEYLAKDNPLPIYMQLRDSTSYPIIMKQFQDLIKGTDYSCHLEELGQYQHGYDTMHEVAIVVEKTK